MALYDNIDSSLKTKKQQVNKNHIRNLKIMNVLNASVMTLLLLIDVFLLFKGVYTGMPLSVTILLVIFVVAQFGSLLIFSLKKFARASMITKVGIMIICFMPIVPYIIYLSIGNNIYIACLIGRIIALIALAMLLFNTKSTDDKKTFGVKGVPLAIASGFLFLALLYILVSTTNRKVIYGYDNLYNGYVVTDVLSGKGDVVIKDDTVAINSGSLKNVSGNLVIPASVKYIQEDAFLDSDVTSLEVYSTDINLMDAINNSNIDVIYLKSTDAKLDLSRLEKDIEIRTDRSIVDQYRETYRQFDYLFVPEVFGDEYYVCFNGTTLPVYIYTEEQSLNEPDSSLLPSSILGRSILYDGYFINTSEITFPYSVSENTKITCKYSFIYNITYDFSDVSDTYDLPSTYYDKLGDIELPILEKEGYQFKGWFNVDEYGNYTKQYEVLDSSVREDLNLKAKFLKEFSVTYDKVLSDATLDGDSVEVYTEEDEIILKTPTLEGFSFDGWYLDKTYNVKATTYLNSDATLYAKWNINEPNIELSNDINKTFDNQEEDVYCNAASTLDDVTITYSFYDSDDCLITSENSFTVINVNDSSNYYAIVTLNYKDIVITEYKTDYINVTINKAKYDMSGVSLEDVSYTYDGTAHTPILKGTLPTGIDNIQVTYTFTTGGKNVGVTTVLCNFNGSTNYEKPKTLSADVAITKRVITITWSTNLTFEYDGNTKSPSYTLNNVIKADQDSISCNSTGSANGVGVHTFKITSIVNTGSVYKNYALTSDEDNLSIEYEIVEKVNEIDGITVEAVSVDYDGEVHLPKVSIEQSGIEAIYSLEPVNVGTYNVTVTFKYTYNENELIGNSYTVTVTILQREVDVTWSYQSIEYNSQIQVPTCSLSNVVSGDVVTLDYSYINSVNAGTYSIEYLSLLGEDKDNYKLKETSYEYEITPIEVHIDINNLDFNDTEYTYNGKNQYPTISKDNLPENVIVTYEGYGKNVGTYEVVATFSINSTNYTINEDTKKVSITVTINQLVAQITWIQTSFVYDEAIHKPTAIVSNLISGDTCEVTVTCSDESEAGTYTATASALSNSNYLLEDNVTTEYTISSTSYDVEYTYENISVVYDGNYHMPEVVLEEEYDWLTITYNTEYGIKDVGSLVVTATFVSTNPSYEVPDPVTAVVEITPRSATIGFSLSNNIYNGSAIYPTAYVSNLISGDTAELTLDSGENNINAGSYTVSVIDISNSNYTLGTDIVSYEYEIKKATYDLSNIQFLSQTFTYNGYAQRPSISAIDEEIGTEIVGIDGVIVSVTYSTGRTNVGSQTVIATFTGSSNYNDIAQMSATVTITQREVTLVWTGSSFTYTGSVLKPECIVSGLVLNDECSVTVNAQGVNVGTYIASATNLTNSNYKLPSDYTFEYTITKATISLGDLTFKTTSKVYDSTYLYPIISGTIPENVELSYSGLSANVGVHTITISFIVSENYNEIQAVEVDVEITARTVSLTWGELEATYTGSIQYPNYELSNIISGDSLELSISGGGVDVGEYTIQIVGLSNTNYQLDETEDSITYSIVCADYDMSSITFSNVTKEYNGEAQYPIISGTLPSGVSVSYSGYATNVSDGTVTVTATFTTTDSNYNAPKSMKATITIIAKELTVIWSNTTFDYDGNKHQPTATLQGLLNDDECSATLQGYGINAGTYEISIASLSNTNYQTSSTVTITINKADYDMSGISFEDATYTYDGASHQQTISGSLASVIGLDGISPEVDSYKGSVTNVSDGVVTCVVTFKTTSDNYNVPSDMTCEISVSAIVLDLTIYLDTNTSQTASERSWSNSYYLSITYDSIEHTCYIEPTDTSSIISGDTVQFSISGTFKDYNEDEYEFSITSDNLNYSTKYDILNVQVNQLNTGYYFEWMTTNAVFWNGLDYESIEDIVCVYTDSNLGTQFYGSVSAYGSYYLSFISTTDNVVINSTSKSSVTYNVSLTEDSLLALIDYYDLSTDSVDDSIILDYDTIQVVEELYNDLGVTNTSIEAIISNSYAQVIEQALFIEFSSGTESTSDLCIISGSLKSDISSKTYYGHEFSTALKIEQSTTISLDLSSSSYTYMILVTDSANKRMRVSSTTYTTDSNGIIKISDLSDTVNIRKYDSMNLYGIILI